MFALVPLAPVAHNDVFAVGEDQVLTGNVLTGAPAGTADTSAAAGLPLLVVESTVTTALGATLNLGTGGGFTFDPSTSAILSAIPAGASGQDSFTYTVAPDFSNVFVFGDSLSDQGRLFAATNQQFPPDPPYFQGRISNGPVWVEDFADRLDLPLSLVNNFSVAGAATSSANYNESILQTDLPGLADQLQQFLGSLNGQPADPNSLYVVWAGANDFFLPFTDPAVVIGQAVTNLATTVGTLQLAGAQHIVVINLPDLGLTPYARSLGQEAQLTGLSAAFNDALQGALAGPGLQSTYVDIFSTFQAVAANPAAFGLTNVTDSAFNGAAVIGNPADFLFWDSVHPTAAGHQLISDAVLDAISSTADVTINVAGVTTAPTLTVQNTPGAGLRSLQLQVSATDASAADQAAAFNYVIQWGDGSPLQTVTASAAGTVVTHNYAANASAVQQVSVFVRDQDGDVSTTLREVVTWGTQGSDRIDLLAHGSNSVRRQLQDFPKVGFDQSGATYVQDLLKTTTQPAPRPGVKSAQPLVSVPLPADFGFRVYERLALKLKQPEVVSLPWQKGADCQLGQESATWLQVNSTELRNCLLQATNATEIASGERLKSVMFTELQSQQKAWIWDKPECVPTLAQMLQAEKLSLRLLLIERLAQINGKEASRVLAQRAIFDLSPEVREQAVAALQSRPPQEYQQVLLAGLRWPWSPVADHAAETIAALHLTRLAPELTELLDQPDPTLPFLKEVKGKKALFVKEIVQINHLSNCLLCHAPSVSSTDLVRGMVPSPGQGLAPVYYGGSGQFVRADTTFLRQDFSVVQPVANPGAWPAQQRFDYLLRERRATPAEIKQYGALAKAPPVEGTYPQRAAVLFALEAIARAE